MSKYLGGLVTATINPLGKKPAEVEYLVVAGGGGGGGSAHGAGGGAGGSYVVNENVTVVPAISYNVTVGSGGAQSGNSGANGNNGSNTISGSTTPVIANGGSGGSSGIWRDRCAAHRAFGRGWCPKFLPRCKGTDHGPLRLVLWPSESLCV